jgi:hypothetical protein
MIHGRKHSAEPRRFTRRQRGEIGEAPTDSTISLAPPAGIEPTRGLGTGAQLEKAANDLRDRGNLFLSTILREGSNAKRGARPFRRQGGCGNRCA